MYIYIQRESLFLQASKNIIIKKKHKTIRQMLMESPELLTKMYRV
jgi:hypothetical protein